jgi:hypothetical protein
MAQKLGDWFEERLRARNMIVKNLRHLRIAAAIALLVASGGALAQVAQDMECRDTPWGYYHYWFASDPFNGHGTGQQLNEYTWAAVVGRDAPGHLTYGPYDTVPGRGWYKAGFYLRIDDNRGSDVVATIDVVGGYGTWVLARKDIKRSDFKSSWKWQFFYLGFLHPCHYLIEYRVYWHGRAYMEHHVTLVEDDE